jgi:1-deoxy-D-xylulose-5-phosphate synthase
MALSTTFSVPRGFLAVPAHQDSHFASAAEQLHGHKSLQARPLRVSIISSACFITQA